MKTKERVLVGAVIILVAILSVFLGTRKVAYNLDEIWNYGLANNVGNITPKIEFGKEYSGMGPFETYMEVETGERFNYVSVWQNQAHDVHPPFYYLIFHTICSFFPNTFSKWYGIALNIFWMVFILILLYKLAKEITKSEVASLGIILAYGTSVIFLNTIVFIRMYTQFVFFSVALAYLLKLYWDNELDKKFYGWLSAILILGMLTHYYFLIYSFFICVCFAINLIMGKKFKELRTSAIVVACSGVFYLAIWYHIGGHLFRGYRGKQAISQAFSLGGMFKGAKDLLTALSSEALWGLFPAFGLLIIALLVLKIRNKEKIWNFESALLISCVLYVLVVGKIAPFIASRYAMNTAFGFIMIGYLVLNELVTRLWKNKYAECVALLVFLVISMGNLITRNFTVPYCYHEDDLMATMELMEGKDAVVNVEESWYGFCFFEHLLHAKSYTFVNEEMADEVYKTKENYMLLTYTLDPDAVVEGLDAELIYKSGNSYYYLVH